MKDSVIRFAELGLRSKLAVRIVIQSPVKIALYQKLSQKVGELRVLEMSLQDIADSLNVSHMTRTD